MPTQSMASVCPKRTQHHRAPRTIACLLDHHLPAFLPSFLPSMQLAALSAASYDDHMILRQSIDTKSSRTLALAEEEEEEEASSSSSL
jgi:hypothetical protein